jgi:hypothetical protein
MNKIHITDVHRDVVSLLPYMFVEQLRKNVQNEDFNLNIAVDVVKEKMEKLIKVIRKEYIDGLNDRLCLYTGYDKEFFSEVFYGREISNVNDFKSLILHYIMTINKMSAPKLIVHRDRYMSREEIVDNLLLLFNEFD